jgi:hypothetical protein
MSLRAVNRWILLRGLLGGMLTSGAGWFLSTLPARSWPMQHGPLAEWRSHTWVLGIAMAVSVSGLLLIAWAWSDLIKTPVGVRLTASVWMLPFLIAPPLFSEDAYAYGAQGMLQRVGLSPYLHGTAELGGPIASAVAPHWQHTPAPYGPLHLWLGDAFTYITTDAFPLAMLHRSIPLVGWLILMWAAPRLARLGGLNEDRLSAIILASPFMYGIGIGGVHNDVLVGAGIACALIVAARINWIAASTVIGLTMCLKVTAVLGVLPIVLITLPIGASMWRRIVRFAGATVVCVAILIAGGFIGGFGFDWVHGLSGASDRPSPVSPLMWVAWWAPDSAIHVLSLVAVVATIGVALLVPTGIWRRALADYVWVVIVVVVFATAVRLPYFFWLLPAAAAAPMKRQWIIPFLAVVGALAPVTSIPGLAR